MKSKIVFLFSGQGSQYPNMGKELFLNHPIFRKSIENSNVVFTNRLHRSLIDELYYNNTFHFNELLITHPAIVAIEIAMLETIKAYNVFPDYVFGQSLGEFVAAVASGVWTASDALEAAIEQAKRVGRSSVSGGMLTVVSSVAHREFKVYEQYGLYLAMDNFKGHFTVSGSLTNLDRYQHKLETDQILYSRVPVNVPFHSSLILEGFNGFSYLGGLDTELSTPNVSYVSSLNGGLKKRFDYQYFDQVVSSYSDFSKGICYLEQQEPCLYIDLGPSGTSANFTKRSIAKESKSYVYTILSPYTNVFRQLEKLTNNL